jgi:fructose-1,6-bisphosphatase/inositol monophosphatase family enzyme
MTEYQKFIKDILAPEAIDTLSHLYDCYINDNDLDIKLKEDKTPASIADRNTESLLRELITSHYPTHGIWGEEFGAYQLDNDYVWILDPLDGTKEFLQRKPHHFGCLIGLLYKESAITGAIIDPLSKTIMMNGTEKKLSPLNQTTISCTNITTMFGTDLGKRLFADFDVIEGLNCIGFADSINGVYAACVERDLSLHDIAALIPILLNAGLYTYDLKGNDYREYKFNPKNDQNKKFSIVTSYDKNICDKIIQRALL